MAREVDKRPLTPGFTRADVEGLLGDPDESTAAEYQYLLGVSGNWQDINVLHVYFDEHGNVKGTEILRH